MKKLTRGLLTILLLAFMVQAKADNKPQIKIASGTITVVAEGKEIVQIDSICFNFIKPDRMKVISKDQDAVKLLLEFDDVMGRSTPTTEDKEVELIIETKGSTVHFMAEPKWTNSFCIYLKDLGGHYFGLRETLFPDNLKSPDLRGNTYDVELKAEHSRYYENCASVFSAFYFNSLGYASFVDTYSYGRYELAINGRSKIYHTTKKLDWYIFTGSAKEIYKSYYEIIGKPKYVPEWACGPIAWRDDHKQGAKQIIEDAEKFSELEIPLTGMFVDRPYSNGANAWSKMDFNAKFANPEQWIKELNDKYDLEFMTWIAPATWGDKDFPGRLAGGFGYFDLTNPKAVEEWTKRMTQNQYVYGVKGHKMDRADEYFPVAEGWHDKTSMAARYNKYGYLYSKITDQMLNKHWGDDNFNFARAAFHRAQPHLSAVWGGDVRTSWEGMASNLANAMRCSFMGFPNWGTDVGGYFGKGMIPENLFMRWLQFGAYTGFYEIKIDGAGGAAPDRAPWNCSEELQKEFKRICEVRMQMMPYIYSYLNNAHKNGALMKPLAMVYPKDEQTYSIWSEYLFGDAFLVAPILTVKNSRNVYLPEGEWISMLDGKTYKGKQHISVTAEMNEIPVFIRMGSIYVQGNTTIGNQKLWREDNEQLDVYFYPQRNEEFHLIEDKQDKVLKGSKTDNEIILEIPEMKHNGTINVFSKVKPKKVTVNGKRVRYKYNVERMFIQIAYKKNNTYEFQITL
ncbi:glycoside hydrolase family 31 protein [Puteibacter caeruleilacunae]|nr:glycoside hydrolase family 31 protein [Puteibacter caeruleilacunae]